MTELESNNNPETDQEIIKDEQILENIGMENNQNLDVILNIPVQISLELGKSKMQLRELMKLGQGSVIELEKMVDEPLDVLVNGALIAQGEVVVVDNKFAIRLTDIVSPEKRVQGFNGI